MLSLQHFHVSVGDKIIIPDLSIDFEKGKNYCILGKNGSGKSSLAMGIMGHPSYDTAWKLILDDGKEIIDVLALDPHERAKLGIFVAFQNIPEIKGVKLFEFLRSIYNATTGQNLSFVHFKRVVMPLVESLKIDSEFLWRDINVWFSGWERRKIEMLQLKLLQPSYIFLDEIDSGLDVDAFRDVAMMIQELNTSENTFVIITHYFTILEYIAVDTVFVLENGYIVKQGGLDLALTIKEEWFN